MTTDQHDIAALRRRSEHAESDAAALRVALGRLLMFVASGRHISDADRALISDTMASDRPGARLLIELEAARAVVDAARSHDWGNIGDALYTYDAAVKARDL